jgi:hypothetical protein
VFADLPNGGDAIQLDSVAVKSMPRYSNLTPSVGLLYPVSGGYFDGAAQTRTSNYDDADNLHFYDSIVFYIPEHRLSDINYKTYLSVKASLKGNTDPAEQVEFKIALGDGVKSHDNKELMEGKPVPAADLFITRNTHYQVTATIKSFDKANQSEIDVITNVIIWELTATDEPYIGQHELKISQDKFYITGNIDFEGTVTVETDDPKGWSAARSATASTVKFYNASTTAYDLTSLDNQTGTKLRFKSSSVGVNDSISITAGPIVKRIYLIRQ